MDDMSILAIVLSAQMFAFILGMIYLSWKSGKERRERELKDFIAQSIADWPVERALNDWLKTAAGEGLAKFALNDWLKTATSEGTAKYTLQDWLKAEVASWPVKEVLRKQISEIVESEVRRQLFEAKLEAA